jgi:protein-S-isoprenylcysteine O-methyltransferase Ste14
VNSDSVSGTATRPSGWPSWLVAVGNAFFHHRNALFPAVFIALAVLSRPLLLRGSIRADRIVDALGIAIALSGQALRALVIGLAYIRRGGKSGRIHADELVQDGFFAHSRNPLYLGNLLVYLGLFVVLDSVPGWLIGVPFFFFAYLAITAAEEDFLQRRFGAVYEAYRRRVPRFLPNWKGLGATVRGMRFDWRRLLRKEYGSTFIWMSTALALVYWESVRNAGTAASATTLALVLVLWLPLLVGYGSARYLKKSGRL